MRDTESSPRILIVDDDFELRRFLQGEFLVEGFAVGEADTGLSALTQLRDNPNPFDLVLLDWTLPDFSGVEICRRLRSSGVTVPVVMLTARDDIRDRVEALDSGADDFINKPFSIEELLARVRARMRRTGLNLNGSVGELLSYRGLTMNTGNREVRRNGAPIHLTVREYDLLQTLLREPNRVQTRNQILASVWGANHFGDDNLLDVYIRYLRKKVEQSGCPSLIQTVRGVGFMLKEGDPWN
ncbi:response regulator transcription factor [Synechococcus sp. CS-602]|nr:DNA-binding response regulator [Synechococcus sp. SynAce01]MCT0202474.1 response regulator transcription factor [Synechococcus sp. CS-603]MCT0204280.1 response regulator transcription factor [Synechococcus sp. CS-602]MCT0247121.1 response regulator transcription factor [Synechococcus sp. CS-601]